MLYTRIRTVFVLAEARLAIALADVPLTVHQWNALAVLAEAADPVRMGVLSDRLLADNTTVTRIVDSLETRKAVERITPGSDRRARAVKLTTVGRDLYQRAGAVARRVEQEFTGVLAPGDRGALDRLLAQLADRLQTDQGE